MMITYGTEIMMSTHTRNPPGFPGGSGRKFLVFDSETGVAQDPASVHDVASYYRYLLISNSAACEKRDDWDEAESTENAGQ